MKIKPSVEREQSDASGRRLRSASGAGACLNVTLQSASDLMAKDLNGKSDPACWLRIREQRFKSTTQFMTLSPTWNEHFQFVDLQPDEVGALYRNCSLLL